MTAHNNSDIIRASARTYEPDRYLAALLAPRSARDDLITLAAFCGEVRRIPVIVADPNLAEIRLQWWRDALLADEGATGNPIADAFKDVLARHRLSPADFESWFDAVAHTLYAAAPEDEAHLALEHELIEGAMFAYAARILGAGMNADAKSAIREAAISYGLARLGMEFPYALARGRLPLPGLGDDIAALDHAASARALTMITVQARKHGHALQRTYADLASPLRTALLPVALVEPYLRALERQGHDLKRDLGDVAPLVRVWRLWRAHALRRI